MFQDPCHRMFWYAQGCFMWFFLSFRFPNFPKVPSFKTCPSLGYTSGSLCITFTYLGGGSYCSVIHNPLVFTGWGEVPKLKESIAVGVPFAWRSRHSQHFCATPRGISAPDWEPHQHTEQFTFLHLFKNGMNVLFGNQLPNQLAFEFQYLTVELNHILIVCLFFKYTTTNIFRQ